MHGNEELPSGYRYQGQVTGLNLLSQQGRANHLVSSASGEYDNVGRTDSYANINIDAHFGAHPISQLENPYIPSDRRIIHEDDVIRFERKRKVRYCILNHFIFSKNHNSCVFIYLQSEEAKIAREVEAHEKRIRRELEKQDILRRKVASCLIYLF